MPVPPEEGVEIPLAEPVDGLRHLALEGESTHLAVRDDIEPGVLLQAKRSVDRRVLDALEARELKLAAVSALARLEQLGRPEQAVYDIGSGL